MLCPERTRIAPECIALVKNALMRPGSNKIAPESHMLRPGRTRITPEAHCVSKECIDAPGEQ